MSLDLALLILGGILLLLGFTGGGWRIGSLKGGGVEGKEVTVPKVQWYSSIGMIITGGILIIFSVGIYAVKERSTQTSSIPGSQNGSTITRRDGAPEVSPTEYHVSDPNRGAQYTGLSNGQIGQRSIYSDPAQETPRPSPNVTIIINYAADKTEEMKPPSAQEMSCVDLRLYRNAIFAKHGRAFRDRGLQAYFDRMPWYQVDYGYSDRRLSRYDKQAIADISAYEKYQGCR